MAEVSDTAPLGLVAGGGDLPYMLAKQAVASGRSLCVVGLSGMAEAALMADFSGIPAGLGEAGKILDILRRARCRDVVMAGQVQRPDFGALKLDKTGLRLLPRILVAACRGDAALLKIVASLMEEHGLTVRSVQEIAPTLKMGQGSLREGLAPGKRHWPDIRRAAEIVAVLGGLDIGQGAIVCDGLVLCVEAQEGTEQMLKRCAALPEAVRGSEEERKGVLLKAPKSLQDRRTDMPVIGVQTVRDVAKAGLSGIALEAEGALVLDEAAVAEAAQQAGLFIYGYSPDEV